jgi:hypothetical protein
MKRMAIFTSACCTGWAFSYNADNALQQMIRKHADQYNSAESSDKRNGDGSVEIYDNVEQAIESLTKKDSGRHHRAFTSWHQVDGRFMPYYLTPIETEEQMFEFFRQDGEGGEIDAAWVVHMLLSDPTADDWMP